MADTWKKMEIPVNVNDAQEKLKIQIRKGVPDSVRRRVFLSITGAAELKERSPTMYHDILTKLYGM